MPAFYVHLLNPDVQALGEAGIFTGEVTTPEAGLTTLAINIPLADIKSHFKFKCVGDASDDGSVSSIDITGVVGVADETDAKWTFPASNSVSAQTMSNEFISLLAQKVFGSLGAADLFSNRTAVESAWHDAAALALASLKEKTYDYGITASKELIDAMFHTDHGKAIRFSMAYDAETDAAVSTAAGDVAADVAVSGGSGSGAHVQVTLNGILVKTAGSGYAAGDSITIGSLSFKINSVQAAMLNGNLDDAAGTNVPLRVGDKILVIYEIDSKAGQKDASGDDVSVAQRFNVEYTMTA